MLGPGAERDFDREPGFEAGRGVCCVTRHLGQRLPHNQAHGAKAAGSTARRAGSRLLQPQAIDAGEEAADWVLCVEHVLSCRGDGRYLTKRANPVLAVGRGRAAAQAALQVMGIGPAIATPLCDTRCHMRACKRVFQSERVEEGMGNWMDGRN